jgi:hypothetical protein
MVEADALVDLDVSDDLEVSDFIWSVEEADGGELVLGLDGDGACAKADESINPLSAVVINNF